MKLGFYFGLLILCANHTIAQNAGGNGPRITFAQLELDYGPIKEGSDGRRVFVFKNTGNEPLLISSCRGSCGCTVPTCPIDAIPPGKTAKVEVQYDTKRTGPFNKTVTVVSNAIDFPALILRIRGLVEAVNSTPLVMPTIPSMNVRQER